MINSFSFLILLSFFKLLTENTLLMILMIMEMISMLVFFFLLSMNLETLALTSCVVSILTIMISESVLSLGIFVNLTRNPSKEKISALNIY